MLSVEESATLFSLLKADQRPLEEITSNFDSRFPSSSLRFRTCVALSILLQDKMLRSSECLVAFCILHHAYSSQQSSANPFIYLLINAVCDEAAQDYERALVLQLLGASASGGSKEVLKQCAADYIKGFTSTSHAFLSREHLQEQYGNKAVTEPYNSLFRDSFVKNVIPDPDVPRQCDASSPEFDLQPGSKSKIGSGSRDETVVGLLQHLSPEGIGPQWIRPFPPRLPVQHGELVWLNPDSNHELLWDYGMCADTSRGAAVRDLIAKALKGTLAPAQQEDVLKVDFLISE